MSDAERKIPWNENDLTQSKHVHPSKPAAKTAILAECHRLTEAGITFVAVHFEGSGDEGVSEDIKCYATENHAYEESEVQNADFSH